MESPIAFVASISGNMTAFEAILESIHLEDIRDIVCLGNVFGVYPWPKECIQLAIKNCMNIIGQREGSIYEGCKNGSLLKNASTVLFYKSVDLAEKLIVDYRNQATKTLTIENMMVCHKISENEKKYTILDPMNPKTFLVEDISKIDQDFFVSITKDDRRMLSPLPEIQIEGIRPNKTFVGAPHCTSLLRKEHRKRKGKLIAFYTIVSREKIEVVEVEYEAKDIIDEVKRRDFWWEIDIQKFEEYVYSDII